MKRFLTPATLRGQLAVVVLAVVVPLTGLAFVREWDRRRVAIDRLEESTSDRAEVVATGLETQFAGAQTMLLTLSRLLDPAAPPERIDSLLARLHRDAPFRYANLWLTDTVGRSLGSARDPARRRAAFTTSDRRDFRAALRDRRDFRAALRDRRFTVGDVVPAQVFDGGTLVLPFLMPRVDSAGRATAVFGASVFVDSLEVLVAQRDLPPGSVITLVDSTGVVQYRSRDAGAWIGRSLAASPGFAHNRTFRHGVDTTTSADGMRRMVAFETLPTSQWIVYIGIPVSYSIDLVGAQFRRDLAVVVALAAALLLLGQLLVSRITAPIESLTADAGAIAAGEVGRRSSLSAAGEIGALSLAFNRMADTVEERNRALAESEARYRVLFESNPVPVVVWAVETGEILLENRAAAQHFAGEGRSLVGRSVSDVLRPAECRRFMEHMRALPSEARHDGEWRFHTLEGVELDVELLSVAFPRAEGSAMLHVIIDVTARRAAERALEESREELRHRHRLESLGSFAAGIAHDFNNYLATIVGFSGLVRERVSGDAEATEDVDEILGAARRAADLTRLILVFSRRQSAEPRPHSVGETVRELVPMLTRLLGEQVTLETRLDDGDALTRVDRAQLEQAVMNLTANARDAMPRGGRFVLATRRQVVVHGDPAHPGVADGDYVVLEAADTGSGVPSEQRARIFDPFFTTKPRGAGTGLGLSVVFGVMRQAGGHVRLDEAHVGGARFVLYFPVVAARRPEAATATELESGVPGGAEHVLLVEDDATVRSASARILESAGYAVTQVANADEGRVAFAAAPRPVDLLLTDLVMPGDNGRVLADALRAASPGLSVLYTSGYTDDEVVLRAIADSGLDFLPKPATREQLLRAVRRTLDAAEPLAASLAK